MKLHNPGVLSRTSFPVNGYCKQVCVNFHHLLSSWVEIGQCENLWYILDVSWHGRFIKIVFLHNANFFHSAKYMDYLVLKEKRSLMNVHCICIQFYFMMFKSKKCTVLLYWGVVIIILSLSEICPLREWYFYVDLMLPYLHKFACGKLSALKHHIIVCKMGISMTTHYVLISVC